MLVGLPFGLGVAFILGGVRIMNQGRSVWIPRAKGRTGFQLPVTFDGKVAVASGKANVIFGCSLWLIALFFLVLFFI